MRHPQQRENLQRAHGDRTAVIGDQDFASRYRLIGTDDDRPRREREQLRQGFRNRVRTVAAGCRIVPGNDQIPGFRGKQQRVRGIAVV